MSELQELKNLVVELSARVQKLESSKPDPKRVVEDAGPNFICDRAAIAHLFGVTENVVKHGGGGSHKIKRLPGSKIRAYKRDVLAALADRNRPASEIAARMDDSTTRRRRKSLIKRVS